MLSLLSLALFCLILQAAALPLSLSSCLENKSLSDCLEASQFPSGFICSGSSGNNSGSIFIVSPSQQTLYSASSSGNFQVVAKSSLLASAVGCSFASSLNQLFIAAANPGVVLKVNGDSIGLLSPLPCSPYSLGAQTNGTLFAICADGSTMAILVPGLSPHQQLLNGVNSLSSIFIDAHDNCWVLGDLYNNNLLEISDSLTVLNSFDVLPYEIENQKLENAVISNNNMIYAMFTPYNQSTGHYGCNLVSIAPNGTFALLDQFPSGFAGCQATANLVLDNSNNLWLSHPALPNTINFGPQPGLTQIPIALSTSLSFNAGKFFPSIYVLSVPADLPQSSSLTFIVQSGTSVITYFISTSNESPNAQSSQWSSTSAANSLNIPLTSPHACTGCYWYIGILANSQSFSTAGFILVTITN